jgi:hypothetical protein
MGDLVEIISVLQSAVPTVRYMLQRPIQVLLESSCKGFYKDQQLQTD